LTRAPLGARALAATKASPACKCPSRRTDRSLGDAGRRRAALGWRVRVRWSIGWAWGSPRPVAQPLLEARCGRLHVRRSSRSDERSG
jgi:hypothetical protein